ncbi:MAG TPA: UrcA family protein [Steroidobacteraceae bacterium]|jgi:UrcA family protein|nr:UrcA family protein [Steroidobacteraceae bacterium]
MKTFNSTLINLGRSFVLVLSAGSALGLATTDKATGSEAPQIAVSYHGLDLSRPADARVLYARLRRAAGAVCQPVSEMELSRHLAWEQCYRAALERAVNQLNAPQVLALYRADAGAASGHG